MVFLRSSIVALSALSSCARASGPLLKETVMRSHAGKASSLAFQNNAINVRGGDSTRQSSSLSETKYVKLADPAPGSPFHLALPVHNLEIAKDFYGNVLGCAEGRSSEKWQDYSLYGHQVRSYFDFIMVQLPNKMNFLTLFATASDCLPLGRR